MKTIHITETVAHLKIDRTYSSSEIVKQTNWRQRDIIFPRIWNASCRSSWTHAKPDSDCDDEATVLLASCVSKTKIGPLATTRIRFETSLQ